MGWVSFIAFGAIIVLLAKPVGWWLLAVYDRRPLPAADRVLGPVERAIYRLRRGFRLAERLHGVLHIVHVAAVGRHLAENEREALNYIWETGRNLGGQSHELAGDDIATEIVEFATVHRATFIVLGQSVRSRMSEVLRGSIVTRIMRETRGIDVVIVSDREEGDMPRREEPAY